MILRLGEVKSGWLVAPLISKLPPSVQGRVLKAAAAVLENGQLKKEKGSLFNQGYLMFHIKTFYVIDKSFFLVKSITFGPATVFVAGFDVFEGSR